MIDTAPSSNLPWNEVFWNAANTPVPGSFLDGFVPGSYDLTIGSSTGVLTITSAPEPGMFASTLLGFMCLACIALSQRRKLLL